MLAAIGEERFDEVNDVAHHIGYEGDRLRREREVAGLDAGDVEHVVDQLEQVPAAFGDLRRPLLP